MRKNKHEAETNIKLTEKQTGPEKLSQKELDKVSGGAHVQIWNQASGDIINPGD